MLPRGLASLAPSRPVYTLHALLCRATGAREHSGMRRCALTTPGAVAALMPPLASALLAGSCADACGDWCDGADSGFKVKPASESMA